MKNRDRYGVLQKAVTLIHRHLKVCCTCDSKNVFNEPMAVKCSCYGNVREVLQQKYLSAERDMIEHIRESCEVGITVNDLLVLFRDSLLAFGVLGERHDRLKAKLGITSALSSQDAMRAAIRNDTACCGIDIEIESILHDFEGLTFDDDSVEQLVDRVYFGGTCYDEVAGILMTVYLRHFLKKTEWRLKPPDNYLHCLNISWLVTSPQWAEDARSLIGYHSPCDSLYGTFVGDANPDFISIFVRRIDELIQGIKVRSEDKFAIAGLKKVLMGIAASAYFGTSMDVVPERIYDSVCRLKRMADAGEIITDEDIFQDFGVFTNSAALTETYDCNDGVNYDFNSFGVLSWIELCREVGIADDAAFIEFIRQLDI